MTSHLSRRQALAASAAAVVTPYFFSRERTIADETKAKNDRPLVGCIGNGGMGHGDAGAIKQFGDIVATCDVDRSHAESLNTKIAGGKAEIYEDYRKLLDRKDVELVTISTPDHWHTKIAIDALWAGKDVHCQKPLTLTIDEGKLLCKVVKETGRVFQVGTQQRSEQNFLKAVALAQQGRIGKIKRVTVAIGEGKLLCKVVKETGRVFQVGTQQRSEQNFLKAVALAQQGRIGKIKRVTVAIGGAPKGGTFQKTQPPTGLNWELWLGQAPLVDYIKQRCHGDFRWWYEYSGGKMTDWGAHHVDIAQWGIGMEESGPQTIEVVAVEHPVPFEKGWPTKDDTFNAAVTFNVKCTFANGVEMFIRDNAPDLGFDNGVMFEGETGRFFVNRGKLTGKPVEDLADNPLADDVLLKLCKGKKWGNHMGNFVECTRDRSLPISDVYSHHRNLTTCHLANIALRLGRTLKWDAAKELIVGDDEANSWQKREQRKGYEIS